MKFQRVLAIAIMLGVALASLSAQAQTKSRRRPARKPAAKSPAASVRTRIAEGRYQLRAREGSVLQSWDEPWTLYKTKTGYEVTETWKASKEGYANSVVIDVFLAMAPGLYPTEARIGPDQSPNQLVCSMTMDELRCAAGGKQSSLAVSGAYNFFLPSPWLLSSIGRRAHNKKPDQSVPVKLVQMTGMSETGPILVELGAQVAYVGEDQVEVDGARLPASIYEVRGSDFPAIMVWISAEGVVLMMQDSAKPEQRMELVEFKKFGAF